jgi:CheY-like chemotaxis protein
MSSCRAVPLRCLIVDDNWSFRNEIGALLEEQGLEIVAVVASGAEAVQRSGEVRPDVALIDIDLGGESGFELARRLGADSARVPPRVILISTHDEGEYADLIDESPAVGFIAKIDLSASVIRQMLGTVAASEGDGS